MKNRLFTVIPCYNEEEVLTETACRLREKYAALMQSGQIAQDSRIAFVNDGSSDQTWQIICSLHASDPVFTGIDLSRNRGHQNALLAGLLTVKDHADMVVSMDADLQDDIDAMDEMIEKYHEGCDIVYGVRNSRKKDSFFKRTTAEAFYRLMNRLGAKTVFNHADYRLMSRRALDGLSQFQEVNLFLRGLVPMIGYRTDTVLYERHERFAGESKYPLKKMLSFALEGITSLSTKPIRMISALGFLLFVISILMSVIFIIEFFLGKTVSGWASLIVSIWAIGGLLMLAIGVVGEYIGKIYMEVKGRPRFLIARFLEEEDEDER